MKKFSIRIWNNLDIWYNHYLSDKFINESYYSDYIYRSLIKAFYPLFYCSRKFDKLARKLSNGTCYWQLDNKSHRVGKPAKIYPDGRVYYYENEEKVK